MPKIKSPCFDCSRRTVGCHGSCDEYKEYSLKIKENNKIVRTAKQPEAMIYEVDKNQNILKRYRRNK